MHKGPKGLNKNIFETFFVNGTDLFFFQHKL